MVENVKLTEVIIDGKRYYTAESVDQRENMWVDRWTTTVMEGIEKSNTIRSLKETLESERLVRQLDS